MKHPSKPTTNCHRKFLNRLYSQSETSCCRVSLSETSSCRVNQSETSSCTVNQSETSSCRVNQSETSSCRVNQSETSSCRVSQSETNCHQKFLNRLYRSVSQSETSCCRVNQSETSCCRVNQSETSSCRVNQSETSCCRVSQSETNCHRKFLNRLYRSVSQSETSCCRYRDGYRATLCRDTLSTNYAFFLSHITHALIVSSHVITHVIRFLDHVIGYILFWFFLQIKRRNSNHAFYRLNQHVCDIVTSTTASTTASATLNTTLSSIAAQSVLNKLKRNLDVKKSYYDNGNYGNSFSRICIKSTKKRLGTGNSIQDNTSHSNRHGVKMHRNNIHGNKSHSNARGPGIRIFRKARMWIYIVLLWCNPGTAAAADLKKVQLSGYGASFRPLCTMIG